MQIEREGGEVGDKDIYIYIYREREREREREIQTVEGDRDI